MICRSKPINNEPHNWLDSFSSQSYESSRPPFTTSGCSQIPSTGDSKDRCPEWIRRSKLPSWTNEFAFHQTLMKIKRPIFCLNLHFVWEENRSSHLTVAENNKIQVETWYEICEEMVTKRWNVESCVCSVSCKKITQLLAAPTSGDCQYLIFRSFSTYGI